MSPRLVQPFYEFEFGNVAVRGTLEGRGYLSFGAGGPASPSPGGRWSAATAAPRPRKARPTCCSSPAAAARCAATPTSRSASRTSSSTARRSWSAGAGLLETSTELRWRFTERWGGVGFVDTGLVTENGTLTGESDFRVGAGAGVRFYTGIGVLRADLATPVTPRDEDGYVALYIGIGQAF